MGTRATMLSAVRALIEAVSGLSEHKGAVDANGLPATVAARSSTTWFVVTLDGTAALDERQKANVRTTEAIVVGLLVDVKQNDRPAAYERALDLEESITSAVLGGAVPGWSVYWTSTDRLGDAGGGAYLGVRLTFQAIGTVAV